MSRLDKILSALLLVGSCIVWDYDKGGDWIRTGKFKWLFLFLALYGARKVYEKWNLSVAGIFLVSMISYLSMNMPITSVLDMVGIVAVLFLVPLVFKAGNNYIVNCVLLAAVANSVLAIPQILGYHPLWPTHGIWAINPEMGFMGHPTVLGPLLACGVACALYNSVIENAKWGILAAILAIQCILTCSVMSVASLIAVGLLYAWAILSKKYFYISIGLILVSLIIYADINPAFFSTTGRSFWWAKAIGMVKAHLIFGYGIGTWSSYAPMVTKQFDPNAPVFMQMHNDYIQSLFEIGLIGFSFVLFCLVQILSRIKYAISQSRESLPFAGMFVAIGVDSLGNFPMRVAPLALIACIGAYYFIGQKNIGDL